MDFVTSLLTAKQAWRVSRQWAIGLEKIAYRALFPKVIRERMAGILPVLEETLSAQ